MENNKVFIIAEAGVNHNGDMRIAKELINIAVEAEVDAIKFQTFKSESVVSKYAEKADYQKFTTGNVESQLEMVKKLELSYEDFIELKNYCDAKKIVFLSTPFDMGSITSLDSTGMSIFKIPSGEITNLPYLRKIASIGKPIILSTGMSTMDEVATALKVLKDTGAKDISILHCTTEYPTPMADVNLNAMISIRDATNLTVGYSDHTEGIEVAIAAVAMGAEIIEKHFTIDKNMEGPDHKASLDPDELKKMVKAIRNIEKALGDGIKQPAESERKNIDIARKSIVAKKQINKGEVFTEDNLAVKRPGTGISPMKWDEVIGITAQENYEEDELIRL